MHLLLIKLITRTVSLQAKKLLENGCLIANLRHSVRCEPHECIACLAISYVVLLLRRLCAGPLSLSHIAHSYGVEYDKYPISYLCFV